MKILGMGNALVDIIIHLPDDNILWELDLPKGSMQLIDNERLVLMQARLSGFRQELASGGSAANTVHGLCALGVDTGFLGSIGRDEYGNFFSRDMQERGISPKFNLSDSPSGRAMALVSPDSERTFGTFLGAALELGPEHINETLFEGYDMLHIEGYLVQNHKLIEKAVRIARQEGLEVSIDLASYNIVEENREFLEGILSHYVSMVFANEEEARAMTGKEPQAALDQLFRMCGKAIVKIGREGSWIRTRDNRVHIEAVATSPVDTSGAGDLYAAGFIYGMTKGLNEIKCGQIGSILAGKVIEFTGPKIPLQVWGDLLASVKRVERMD